MESKQVQQYAPGQTITSETPTGRAVVSGPGKRLFFDEPGKPMRLAHPSVAAQEACTDRELWHLRRFFDASEMSKGNMTVALLGGQPRGLYAEANRRRPISPTNYANHEIAAYNWIRGSAFGMELATVVEVFARIEGEHVQADVLSFGAHLVNVANQDQAFGASLGALRVASMALVDAYRDWNEMWAVRERAAQDGRALNAEESVTRVRAGRQARQAIARHKPTALDF